MTVATQQTTTNGWQSTAADRSFGNTRTRVHDGQSNGASTGADRLARGLGWFSIALGAAEVLAPRTMARLIGAEETNATRNTLIAFGLREIAAGVGILTQPQPANWVWARVGGDVLDLAFLGAKMRSDDSDRTRAALATAAVLGVTVLDVIAGRQLSGSAAMNGSAKAAGIDVSETITINRAPDEVYRFWRDVQNLPRFMDHLKSVQVIDQRRSHWVANAPAGTKVEWDAEITEDVPNHRISWRSIESADVPNAGTVRFIPAPGGRGTEVHVGLQYNPPAGAIGAAVAKLFGEEPSQQIAGDLRRFKQVIETGEVVHSDASIHRGMHPARPAGERL